MIPAAFDYERAESVEHALSLLEEHGDEAKVLAGGHSLLPLMRFRLATPTAIIDIGRLRELSYVRDGGDHLAIGALTRHRDVEVDELVNTHAGLLALATRHVGDPQVRHRGTIGGSVAHGDPASDLPSALIAMRATMVIRGSDGERTVSSDDFFTGFLETAIVDTELLTEIRVPKATGAGFSFQKFNRRAQDWAIVGASVQVDSSDVGVGLVNMDSRPVRAGAVESVMAGGATIEAAADVAPDGCAPPADLNASVEYRRHLSRVLVRRGLEEAMG